MKKALGVIPARYGSTRFPGKPLALIAGKPMVQRVYENAASCSALDRVVVATDAEAIAEAVLGFGGEALMTSAAHETGTDRIAEAVRHIGADVIVNIQGDEPLLPPEAIEAAALPVLEDASIPMGTLRTKVRCAEEAQSPHVVKVVCDLKGFALYFSRSRIPFVRDQHHAAPVYRHIGLYVYRRQCLFELTALERSPLERTESLEQLRALESGVAIKVSETAYYPLGVDVPEDITRVEQRLTELM